MQKRAISNTTVIIKDDVSTADSAQSIVNEICTPLIAAASDIKLTKIIIAVNAPASEEACYTYADFKQQHSDIDIVIADYDKTGTFAEFHNFAVSLIDTHAITDDVHIISGALAITNGKPALSTTAVTRVGEFIIDLTELMVLLKRDVWFSTASDAANIAFNRYFTALDVLNIDGQVKHIDFPACMMWSGNSNLDWIYINANAKDNTIDLTLDTSYDYDFLSIKDCIARSTHVDGYYVNLFPTIPTEVGAFARIPRFDSDNQQYEFGDKYTNNMKAFADKNNAPTMVPQQVNVALAYMKKIFLPAAKAK